MKLKYALLSALALGIFACEQPQKKEETKKEEPKKEAVAQKQEVKKEEQKAQEQPKQEQKQEQKTVAQAGGAGNPENGKKLFQTKGCNSCHQPAADTVGPSLKKIAQTYSSADELVKFLKSEAKPKVWPDKFAIMKPQLMQLKGLSEQELKDLAAFILSHK